MTAKQFYDWQTAGGTDDVMRFVDALERADIPWCAIGGIAVNHWAAEPVVTRDVDFVVAATDVDTAISALVEAGFTAERYQWSVNFRGASKVAIQLSTEVFYSEFASRSVAADVHGILLRVSALEDTFAGKLKAWQDTDQPPSKRINDLADIARLLETHPELDHILPDDVKLRLEQVRSHLLHHGLGETPSSLT